MNAPLKQSKLTGYPSLAAVIQRMIKSGQLSDKQSRFLDDCDIQLRADMRESAHLLASETHFDLPVLEINTPGKYGQKILQNDLLREFAVLRNYFPSLDPGPTATLINEIGNRTPSSEMECWCVIPYYKALNPDYAAATMALMDVYRQVDPTFYNAFDSKLDRYHYRVSGRTDLLLEEMYLSQKSDFLVFEVQNGLQYQSQSARDMRRYMFDSKKDFAFGGFETIANHLMHENLLSATHHLWHLNAGDVYSEDSNFHGEQCTYFLYDFIPPEEGKPPQLLSALGAIVIGSQNERCGVPTGRMWR